MKELIYSILSEICPFEEIEDSTKLLEDGILDSLTLVYLINEIEEKNDIFIPEEYVKPENFESVNRIIEFLDEIGSMCAQKN